MNPEQVLEMVKKAPFTPFKIWLSDGTAHVVGHPDQILVDRRTCYVGIGATGRAVFQRVAMVSNVHITHLEPLDDVERRSA